MPLAVLMNSFRIGVIGILVDRYGIAQAEGFLHVFEGWVVFLACIGILLLMAMAMQRLSGDRRPLGEALDLDFSGLGGQLARVLAASSASPGADRRRLPDRGAVGAPGRWRRRAPVAAAPRDPFGLFPRELAGWSGAARAARARHRAHARRPTTTSPRSTATRTRREPVDLFLSYYRSQTDGSAIHSPEVCLPGAGWEVSRDRARRGRAARHRRRPVTLNRAVIQKGLERQLVYYWFEGRGRRLTNDFAAKFYTLADSMTRGRTDGGLVRLITPIGAGRGRGGGRRPAAALPRRRRRPPAPLHPGVSAMSHASTPMSPPPPRVVSILVISYNTRAMTLDCLRSVVAETTRALRAHRARQRLARRLGRGDRRRPSPTIRLIASRDEPRLRQGQQHRRARGARASTCCCSTPTPLVLDRAIDRLRRLRRAHARRPASGAGARSSGDRSLDPASVYGDQTLWSLFCRTSGLALAFPRSALLNPELYGGWDRDSEREVDVVSGLLLPDPPRALGARSAASTSAS